MREVLRKYSLLGYHCTKLTREEVSYVKTNGMSLQNLSSLCKRIDALFKEGVIDEEVTERLKSENQANDTNRAMMLWFCFFEPYITGEWGVRRFFRSWGGEALYNSHEDDHRTGSALRVIGIPCVVKAVVPMKMLQDSCLPDTAIIREFLRSEGHNITNPVEHVGFSIGAIPPDNVIEIIEYPDPRFIELTKCNEWGERLSTI
jgi:hypothetical protein